MGELQYAQTFCASCILFYAKNIFWQPDQNVEESFDSFPPSGLNRTGHASFAQSHPLVKNISQFYLHPFANFPLDIVITLEQSNDFNIVFYSESAGWGISFFKVSSSYPNILRHGTMYFSSFFYFFRNQHCLVSIPEKSIISADFVSYHCILSESIYQGQIFYFTNKQCSKPKSAGKKALQGYKLGGADSG